MMQNLHSSILSIVLVVMCIGVINTQNLPQVWTPTLYDIKLFLDPNTEETFRGEITIRLIPNIATDVVTFHAVGLNISSVRIFNERSPDENLFDSISSDESLDFININLGRTANLLQPHTVNINYIAEYSDESLGLYILNIHDINMVISNFETSGARRVFPCYDDIIYKSIFRATIYAPEIYSTVLSNMPERILFLQPDVQGYIKHEFEDSPLISTDLFSIFVSNLKRTKRTTLESRDLSVYSWSASEDEVDFAIGYARENLHALENYFEFDYALPKLDFVGIKDIQSHILPKDSWGVSFYRDNFLLVQEDVTTSKRKRQVAATISSKNSRQLLEGIIKFYGSNSEFLSEGLPSFFQYHSSIISLSELVSGGWSNLNIQDIFVRDGVVSSPAINSDNFLPQSDNLDLRHRKAGALLHMLEHVLTAEVFKKGIQMFLRNNAGHIVIADSLWQSLDEAATEANLNITYTVSEFLNSWSNQGGYPVVTVRRQHPSANSVSVSQEHFLTDRTQTSPNRWIIPVNWVLSTNPEFSDTSPQEWITTGLPARTVTIPGLPDAEWFIFNNRQTGYYRVNYDNDNWRDLAQALMTSHENIHVINRAQLVDDSFNLAKSDYISYTYALDLSKYLSQETNLIPWMAAEGSFKFLWNIIYGTPVYESYQNYLGHLTTFLYEIFEFSTTEEEEEEASELKGLIFGINCIMIENEDCLQKAYSLFDEVKNGDAKVHPDLQEVIYCSGLRRGDPEDFSFLWDQFVMSTSELERELLLKSLGCTTHESSLESYLGQLTNPNSEVRLSEKIYILESVLDKLPENVEIGFKFFVANFSELLYSYPVTTYLALDVLSRRLNSLSHLEKIDLLVEQYGDFMSHYHLNAIVNIKEHIAATTSLRNYNFATIESWLQDNYIDSGGSALHLGTLYLLCLTFIVYSL